MSARNLGRFRPDAGDGVRGRRRSPIRTTLRVLAAVAAVALVAAIVATFVIEEPARRWFVKAINEPLDGYTVALGDLELHPLSASLSLHDLVVSQDALPDPPIVAIRRIDGTLDWRALLTGARVVSVDVEGPVVRLDLVQLREEAGDDKPVAEKGWQEAFYNVSPLEVNAVRVVEGEVTYLDEPGGTAIHVERLSVRARNIRNVRSEAGDYPSPVEIDAQLLGGAELRVEGKIDFLASPRPLGRVDFSLANAQLERIAPIAHHVDMKVRGGVLSTRGTLEHAANETSVVLRELTLDNVEADYVETSGGPTVAKQAVKDASKQAAKAATTSSAETQTRVVIDSLEMKASNFGFVNTTVEPEYRLFVDVATASLHDFSNGKRQKDAIVKLDGTFMKSGTLRFRGKIRPDHMGPGLDFNLQLTDTEIKTLNPALRAHGRLDVVAGQLSVYSEVAVRDRRVSGYVKPIIVDLDVYDPAQDRKKPVLNKIYQGTVGAVARLFKNEQTEQVATVTPIAGRLEAIDADGWRAFVLLLRNAYVEAIQAGLERESAR